MCMYTCKICENFCSNEFFIVCIIIIIGKNSAKAKTSPFRKLAPREITYYMVLTHVIFDL